MRIIHATPPVAKEDKAIGTWKWCGMLDEVDYDSITTMPINDTETVLEASVYAANGLPVKLRAKPSSRAVWRYKLDVGTRIDVLDKGAEWCKVKAEGKVGYMMTEFVKWS